MLWQYIVALSCVAPAVLGVILLIIGLNEPMDHIAKAAVGGVLFILGLIAGVVFMVIGNNVDRDHYEHRCQASGGEAIFARGGNWYCVKKGSILHV